MVSTFTTARNLDKPAAGDELGTWGTVSINPDLDIIDAGMGQTATISAAGGSAVLAANQFRCAALTFSSTLLASITVTFPTSFTGPYSVYNAATGSSAFTITLTTTAAGGQVICPPPGQMVDIWNDGTHLRYRNLPPVSTVMPTMYSSMPNWVDGCTVKPYLNADGSTFPSSVYPTLAAILGSTTLPDYRGRVTAALNQGTARLTAGISGVDGDTRRATGGSELAETHTHTFDASANFYYIGSSFQFVNVIPSTGTIGPNSRIVPVDPTPISAVQPGLSGVTQNVQPTGITGLTLIRAG